MTRYTAPSALALSMIRKAAEQTIDHDIDREDAYRLVAETLLVLGYMPPVDGPDRWRTLLDEMRRADNWGEGLPDAGDQGLTESDWQQMIHDELIGIAGWPL